MPPREGSLAADVVRGPIPTARLMKALEVKRPDTSAAELLGDSSAPMDVRPPQKAYQAAASSGEILGSSHSVGGWNAAKLPPSASVLLSSNESPAPWVGLVLVSGQY